MAIAAGVVLAGVPLLAFNIWLGGLVDRQGQDDVMSSAKRAMALAETRIGQVTSALDRLAAAGVNSCNPAQLDTMRQTTFATMPIKEVSVIGPDGRTLCTDLGLSLEMRNVVSSQPLDVKDTVFEIVQTGANERMVRLRRKAGLNDIAALVPAELFVPQVSTQGGPLSLRAVMTAADGTVMAQSGDVPAESAKTNFTAKLQSGKYGFGIEIALPRARVVSDHGDLQWLGIFASIAVGLIVIGFAALLPRRQVGNPIADIERALAAGEFVPYYQPIVDIRSGQLRGAEVLVRWKKPDGSLVLPGAFIPLAESSGLILDLTLDLMKRVCAEAGAAVGRRPGLKISFNFAAKLFRDDSIVKDVRNIFSGAPIDLSQVVLELTERDPIENLTETRRVIAALQGLGVRIAIDDVGTGHSGLSYMLKLGVDIIKIDKMFVDAIGTDRNSTTIVETLVDLAHNMRMDVVAEGVENFEQVVHLRDLGIRSAQGYVFAPPLPGSAFLQLMDAIDPLPVATSDDALAGAARRYMSARKRLSA
jgi:sensor c-di-GMP phosphodiesterase-like protein